MNLLVDMNLSLGWVEVLNRHGWHASHWSTIGDTRATDRTIMDWARHNGYVVLTHDLHFGALLAITHAEGPSVVQIRTQDVMPGSLSNRLAQVLHQHESALESGALITIDENKSRVRILSLR